MRTTALRALVAHVLLLGLALFSAASAQSQRRVALVIGNGAYQHGGALRNPANDARLMDEVLRRAGFEVILGVDLDRQGMEARIREFGDRLDGGQLGLFFYAGHGIQVQGENYLLPVDARLQRESHLGLETVPLSQVVRTMVSASPTNLIFLDACRNNPLARSFAASMGTRSAAVGQGLAPIQVPPGSGTLVSFATAPDTVALDGEGTANSPFTTALTAHLTTPGLDVGLAMRRVRAAVLAATGRRQEPWDHSSLTGEVVLVPSLTVGPGPTAPAQPVPAAPPAQQFDRETVFWQSALAGGRSADFEAYLQAYPNGSFAYLARSRLAALVVPRPEPPPRPPVENTLIGRIFSHDMLRVQVPYLETIAGPARQVHPGPRRQEREYRVNGCDVTAHVINNEVTAYRITLSSSCTFDLRGMLPNIRVAVPAHQMTFGMLYDALGSTRFLPACLASCGNAADPTFAVFASGSRADEFIEVVATAVNNNEPTAAAADALYAAARRLMSEGDIIRGRFTCHPRYSQLGRQYFRNVRVAEISIGYGLEPDAERCR